MLLVQSVCGRGTIVEPRCRLSKYRAPPPLNETLDEGVCEPAAVCACGVSAFHSHEHGRLMFCFCVAGRRT